MNERNLQLSRQGWAIRDRDGVIYGRPHRPAPHELSSVELRGMHVFRARVLELQEASQSVLLAYTPTERPRLMSLSNILSLSCPWTPVNLPPESELKTVRIDLKGGYSRVLTNVACTIQIDIGLFLCRRGDSGNSWRRSFYPSEVLQTVSMCEPLDVQAAPPVELAVCDENSLAERLDPGSRHAVQRLGEVLVSEGFMTDAQLQSALNAQRLKPGQRLGELLLEHGQISREQLRLGLLRKMGFPVVDVQRFPVDKDLLRKLPYDVAYRMPALPICRVKGGVAVVVDDPLTFKETHRLSFILGGNIHFALPAAYGTALNVHRVYSELNLSSPTWFG